MASDGVPVSLPASLVQGSQAPKAVTVKPVGARPVPQSSNGPQASDADALVTQKAQASSARAQVNQAHASAAQSTKATATNKAELSNLLAQLNKYLNDSGRSFQFRVAPQSNDQTIQEVNPSSGEVVAEFSATQFPALARSLGVSGVLVDDRA